MIEAFSIILLVVFGSMNALSVVDYLVRRNNLSEELERQQEQLAQLERKLGAARAELEDLEFDNDLLEEEQQALQAQEGCMRELEKTHAQRTEEIRRV